MQDRAYLLNANGALDYAHDSSTSFSYPIQSFKAVIGTDLVGLVFIPFLNSSKTSFGNWFISEKSTDPHLT